MVIDLIRPHIRNLTPYSTARDEFKGTARAFLDANENPFESPYNRYPDPRAGRLKDLFASRVGVDSSQVLVTNGSDEAIDLLTRAVVGPEDGVIVTPPTYGMYGVVARALGVKVFEAPLCPDFSVDIPAVKRLGSAGAKLLFLCSPNNPTGNQSSLATISAITEAFEGLIVIDEAYIDFASGPSAMSLLGECDRLVVLRTLSKAWGLAGIRVGFAVGAPELIEALARIKMPYNVNAVSQEIACQALSNPSVYGEQVSLIVSERERVAAALRGSRGVEQVFESEGNFLLVRFVNSGCVFQALRDRGIVVRDRGREVGCERCIRISVGTPEENDVLLCVLREVV